MMIRLLIAVGCLVAAVTCLTYVGRKGTFDKGINILQQKSKKEVALPNKLVNDLNSMTTDKTLQDLIFANSYAQYLQGLGPAGNTISDTDLNTISASSQDALLNYLQPDDLLSGDYDFFNNNPPNLCYRPCNGIPRICYYRFVLEAYFAMGAACGNCPNVTGDCFAKHCVTADGFERAILTINRMLPSPAIEACAGDLLIIDVKNKMPAQSCTLHWHGVHQAHSRWADGVPKVTQCPVLEGNIFRYAFTCDNPGTLWYHSHDGLQKLDGLVGPLNCRVPKDQDPHGRIFDYDLPSHNIIVQDWLHSLTNDYFPGFIRSSKPQLPITYLINGRGRYQFDNGSILIDVPFSQFNVTPGKTYVFRITAGTCLTCQFEFSIEGHSLIIIGTDANDCKPRVVKILTMSPGERYKIAVTMNQAVSAYWMNVRGVSTCASMKAHQAAVLRYIGYNGVPRSPMPTYDDPTYSDASLVRVGPVNQQCNANQGGNVCLVDLRSFYDVPFVNKPQPDQVVVLAIMFHFYTTGGLFNNSAFWAFFQTPGPALAGGFSGISNMLPPAPLVSQYQDIPKGLYCDPQGYPQSTWNQHRECINVIPVAKNIVLEIILCDTGNNSGGNGLIHPYHLHCYDFAVVEQGVFPSGQPFNVSLNNLINKLRARNTAYMPDPVQKDTVALPSGGYLVLRVVTDIQGFCFFHCHFLFHHDTGMSGTFQIGSVGEFDMPPDDFPRCNDYLPTDFSYL